MKFYVCTASGEAVDESYVNIKNAQDLLDIIDKYGEKIIISNDSINPHIMIYDGYIE